MRPHFQSHKYVQKHTLYIHQKHDVALAKSQLWHSGLSEAYHCAISNSKCVYIVCTSTNTNMRSHRHGPMFPQMQLVISMAYCCARFEIHLHMLRIQEASVFRSTPSYFHRNWPILSKTHHYAFQKNKNICVFEQYKLLAYPCVFSNMHNYLNISDTSVCFQHSDIKRNLFHTTEKVIRLCAFPAIQPVCSKTDAVRKNGDGTTDCSWSTCHDRPVIMPSLRRNQINGLPVGGQEGNQAGKHITSWQDAVLWKLVEPTAKPLYRSPTASCLGNLCS